MDSIVRACVTVFDCYMFTVFVVKQDADACGIVDDTASDDDVFSELAHCDSPQFTTVGTTTNSSNSSSKRHRGAATTDQLQPQQQQYTLDHYEDTAGATYVHDDEQQHCDSNAVYDAAACMHDEALQGGFGRGVEADGSVILYREGEGTGTISSTTYTFLTSTSCTCCDVVQ
jgi:hypothetical protein